MPKKHLAKAKALPRLHDFSHMQKLPFSLVQPIQLKVCITNSYHIACWVKLSADDILKYIPYFSQKTEFGISCKLSPQETICIKCQILFFFFFIRKISSVCHLLNLLIAF